MKGRLKKIVAVILTLAMAFSLCSVVSFAATADNVVQYQTYTSLGDSAVAGYGLPGWEEMKENTQFGAKMPLIWMCVMALAR